MVIRLAELLDDQVVFRRTVAGQREAIYASRRMDALPRRFLLIVNGETPLRSLVDLLGIDDAGLQQAIATLVQEGFIETSRTDAPPARPRR